MSDNGSAHLFIECNGCKIENFFSDYSPGTVPICNQCRERLVFPDIADTHKAFKCDDCRMTLLVLKETAMVQGESACRCGSTNISEVDIADAAGDLVDLPEDEDAEPLEDMDWLRSGSSGSPDDEEFNDLFDRDAGMG